jgi:hypothetical protein
MRNAYKTSTRKPDNKRPLGRSRSIRDNNIKMNPKEKDVRM